MPRENKAKWGCWERGWSNARADILDRVVFLKTTWSEISNPLICLEEEHFRQKKWRTEEPWDGNEMWVREPVYLRYVSERRMREVGWWGGWDRIIQGLQSHAKDFISMMRSPSTRKDCVYDLQGEKIIYHVILWNTNNDLLWIIFIIYSFELSNMKISDSFQTFKFCLDFCLFLQMKRGDYNELNLFVI